MDITYSRRFVKKFKKLPKHIQILFVEKETIFRRNPNERLLKFHKLTGSLNGYYAFSINYQYRVLVAREMKGYSFIDVGTHKIYK